MNNEKTELANCKHCGNTIKYLEIMKRWEHLLGYTSDGRALYALQCKALTVAEPDGNTKARTEKAEAEVDRLKELMTNYYTEDQRSFTGVSGATQRAVEKALWPDEDESDV